jgi:hypothetical protein
MPLERIIMKDLLTLSKRVYYQRNIYKSIEHKNNSILQTCDDKIYFKSAKRRNGLGLQVQ